MESTELQARDTAQLSAILQQTKKYVYDSKADNTRKAYKSDWEDFSGWCESHKLSSLPSTPEIIAAYITKMARDKKPSTISRRIASISKAHQAAGFESPTHNILVRETLAGIRRTLSVAQTRKAPVRVASLRQVVEVIPDDLKGKRDRAVLLIGYICAFRRSELVAIDIEDLEFVEEGMRITVRRSKTDQEGKGEVMGVGYGSYGATCPVRATQAWLEASGIVSGPVFRPINRHSQMSDKRLSDKAVGLIIKNIASALGLDPEAVGGHSLRAGFITDQYAAGTAEAVIMKRSRHKSHAVMAGYRREADMFAFNYTAAAGL